MSIYIAKLFFVLIFITRVNTTLPDSPNILCGKCTCLNSEASADCSNKNLQFVPKDLPNNITDLDLAENQIEISNVCQKYPLLTKVSLAWNGLKTISGMLRGCEHLQHLDLTGNVLESLSSTDFEDLHALQELSSIEVQELQMDTFMNLPQLEALNLTFYGISIQPGVFHGLSSLKKLTLTLDKVMVLPKHLFSFKGDNSLESLTIKGFKVKQIQDDLFDELLSLKHLSFHLPQLLELTIENNRKPKNLHILEISNVGSLSGDILIGLGSLETVKLHEIEYLGDELFGTPNTVKDLEIVGCSLSEIPEGWLSNMVALETLNLSKNGLEKLSLLDFSQLMSLKNLILSNNKIRKLTRDVLKPVSASLQQLLVDDNKLRNLDPNTFSDLQKLKILDLSKNAISKITASSFGSLPQLQVLRLSGNYIHSLDSVNFEFFPKLIKLDLAENMVSHFPESVLVSGVVDLFFAANSLRNLPAKKLCKMTSLQNLGVEDNPIFCDCSLRDLHICAPRLQIHGKCLEPLDVEGKSIGELSQCAASVTSSTLSAHSFASPRLTHSKLAALQASPPPFSQVSDFQAQGPSSSTPDLMILVHENLAPKKIRTDLSSTTRLTMPSHDNDDDDDSNHDEIVRTLIASKILKKGLQIVASSTEKVIVSHTKEANLTRYENISEAVHGLNESKLLNESEGQLKVSEIKLNELKSVTSKSSTQLDVTDSYLHNEGSSQSPSAAPIIATQLQSGAGDITIAVFITTALMIGFIAGVWFYRKNTQSGSYNPVRSPAEPVQGSIIQMEPVVVQKAAVPNKKRTYMTVENHQ